MIRNPQLFFEGLKQKRVGVAGLGVSHFELIRLMLRKGISVTVLDKREMAALGEDGRILEKEGARFILGEGYLDALCSFDVLFRTPGMYFLSDALNKAREAGVAVVSEMEVFFDLCPCRMFALTGSDGKTTTSTLISEFFKADGRTVHLGGNIGKALLPQIEQIKPDDVCVVELSSFQLISMRQSPDVAVVTNVAPNHLDVHRDMQEYIDAKKNILLHQNGLSRTVLNYENDITRGEMAPLVRGELCWFSKKRPVIHGSFLREDGMLCRVKHGKVTPVVHRDEIRIPGMHNVDNFLTAIAAVGEEVDDESIRRVAREFGGVEHRIEFVREFDGVRYYNDSIASSPTRTIAGLYSFEQKIIVIAGGYDKKIPYAPLAPALCDRAKAVVLLGATGPKIEEALRTCEKFEKSGLVILHADTLEQAVEEARAFAKPGDVISLSPASASFDLYKNFEERGRHFKRIVNALQQDQ